MKVGTPHPDMSLKYPMSRFLNRLDGMRQAYDTSVVAGYTTKPWRIGARRNARTGTPEQHEALIRRVSVGRSSQQASMLARAREVFEGASEMLISSCV